MNEMPLRIVLVEDRAIDAELVADELERAGFRADLRRVEDEASYCAAIDTWHPDAILADWTLPKFSGRAALSIARQRCPLVPLIFVSGTLPESAAITALRNGATDFVYKNQLDQLGPTLDRALNDVQIRHTLLEREATYRSLFDNMLNGVAYCRVLFENDEARDFIYLSVNPAFEQLTGLKDVIGKRVTEVIQGIRESDPQLLDIFARVARTGKPENFEHYIHALRMWLSISVYSPKPEHFVTVFEVITDRKRAEIGLQRVNRALRTILRCNEVLVNASDETELLQDMCRTIVEVGQHPFAWVGYAEHDEMKSIQPVARFGVDDGFLDKGPLTWADEEQGRGPIGTAIRSGIIQVTQDRGTNPQMTPLGVEALKHRHAGNIVLPLTDKTETFGVLTIYANEINAFDPNEVDLLMELARNLAFGIQTLRERGQSIRDNTEHKAAERQLSDARDVAERANRAKSTFLAMMSHELRTPLNAITGYVDLLDLEIYGPVSDAQRESLGRIKRSGDMLLGLIENVLNLAKIESGKLEFDIEDVRIDGVIESLQTFIYPLIAKKEVEYHFEPCGAEVSVRGDRARIEQIVVNLLSNAAKFTKNGRIEVRCVPDNSEVRIEVCDTGIGIREDQREAVFEPFVQEKSDLTRPYPGTGLGLAICRQFARGMGGDVSVLSREGKGSTFILTLPRASARP
jgi:signal transduction histidine kinase/CheY-like chemotaxis protein